MPEELAVDASEHPMIETNSPKPLHIRFARQVSNILTPVTISIPAVLLVAFYNTKNVASALFYTCVTLFFLSFGPMLYIIIGVRLGKFSDVDVSRRKERTGPFLFSLASVVAGLITLVLINAPKNLQTLLILTAVSCIVMLFITLWWKISIHASSMAGTVTFLTALYGVIVLPAFLLVILVSWSRVVLRRHTVAQVVAGTLVSITLTSAILFIRGV
jgi:membrane-associated phospholipid phosphatase